MAGNLAKILILFSDTQWHEKIKILHKKLFEASYFLPDDQRYEQLMKILDAVRKRQDQALIEFTNKFDNVKLSASQLRVNDGELKEAHNRLDKDLLSAIRKSIDNVRRYQKKIFVADKSSFSDGAGIKYTPIKRIGICVPGASAPLPSTVIMTAVPAQVAGVKEIAVISPPRHQGSIHPIILAVCCELGINEVYRIGGSHAVAALAYGTKTIKKVDKIVGPGNAWVQMAKKQVFGLVDVDSIAGPSEVLIIANDKANPAWVAADMLSQAEHSPGSAVLFTDSQPLAENVLVELEKQVKKLDRSQQTIKCLEDFSAIVVFENMDDCVLQANNFAPEHLEIQCGEQSRTLAEKIDNAGAIFIGDYTPAAVGDYWAGPSHTLPTGMTAKFFSALSSNDFIKSTSIVEYDKDKLARSAADMMLLAQIEGLDAHAKSVQIRRDK